VGEAHEDGDGDGVEGQVARQVREALPGGPLVRGGRDHRQDGVEGATSLRAGRGCVVLGGRSGRGVVDRGGIERGHPMILAPWAVTVNGGETAWGDGRTGRLGCPGRWVGSGPCPRRATPAPCSPSTSTAGWNGPAPSSRPTCPRRPPSPTPPSGWPPSGRTP